MLFKTLISLLGGSLTVSAEAATEKNNGLNFFVVGDFGWVADMTDPDTVFDALNEVKGSAEPGSIDDGEFFVTAGDNLYPQDGYNPTDEEFATMMTLF